MVQWFTGVQGSGKSYFGVDMIYRYFSEDRIKRVRSYVTLLYIHLYIFVKSKDYIKLIKYFRKESLKDRSYDKKDRYDVCLTNINEFKFNKLERVYELDLDQFEEDINKLHKLYKSKVSDEVLNIKAKQLGLYKALIVLDESQSILDVNRPHLVWWISYHRHMFQDLILITQDMSLIHAKYKKMAEAWYRAKSKSITLSNKYFIYDRFVNSRLSQNGKSGSIRVIKRQAVFDLYISGDQVTTKNLLLKYIYLALAAAIFLYFFISFFSFGDEAETSSNIVSVSTKKNNSLNNKEVKYSEYPVEDTNGIAKKIYITLYCDKSYCEVNDMNIPKRMFNKILKYIDHEELGTSLVALDMYKLHLLIEDDYLKYFPNSTIVVNKSKGVERSETVGFDFPTMGL